MLPPELLVRVLQFVPLQQRLSGCAAVCKAWAAASAAATSTISISKEWRWRTKTSTINDWEVPASLESWLQSHGAVMERLDVNMTYKDFHGYTMMPSHGMRDQEPAAFRLPSAELQQLSCLSLTGMALQLPPAALRPQQQGTASSSSMAAVLPNLVELKLIECSVSSQDDLLQLVGTPGLTSVHLHEVSGPGSEEHGDQKVLPMALVTSGPALEQCCRLATLHLQFPWNSLDEAAPNTLASISRLQHLQHLTIVLQREVPADFLPGVPAGLTQLELVGSLSRDMRQPIAVLQHIPKLQHLQCLRVKAVPQFDVASLVNMTQLLCLELADIKVDAAALGRMPHLQQLVLDECNTATPAASALAAIGQLSQLRVLKVLCLLGADYKSCLHQAPVSTMSVLTASSQLQQLHVDCMQDCGDTGAVPDGAILHMFPPGRLLQQLVSLQLGPKEYNRSRRGHIGCLSGEDLQCIAASCPSLLSLHIKGSLKAGATTDALLQLRQCCSLSLGGAANEFDNTAAAVVAQMTQLTHLSCLCSKGFNSMGLQLLTALTNLQQLEIVPMLSDDGDQMLLPDMELDLLAMFGMAMGYPPVVLNCKETDPVWRQVDELCDRSTLVAPMRLQQLRNDKVQLQVGLDQQQEINSKLSREVVELRIRVAELEQEQQQVATG